MAFRKRNTPINRSAKDEHNTSGTDGEKSEIFTPGVRPSFLTSQPTTSTGCASFDSLLGGHGGLPLGSCVLVEESGTTDFAGALLKYFAAEGLCQAHVVHVVGVGQGWEGVLPGVVEGRDGGKGGKKGDESASGEGKMKIAWRYEGLGRQSERALPDRSSPTPASDGARPKTPFCHTFDLAKRLAIPPDAKIRHIPVSVHPTSAPFESIIRSLEQSLTSSPPTTVHRLIVPTILSPALYPPHANKPEHILRFLHALRALLRKHPTNLAALITFPLTLHPRSAALTRWTELLTDSTLELTPFPHLMDSSHPSYNASSSSKSDDQQQPQGMLKVHKLPVSTERGEGGAGVGNSIGEDLAFTVSRRKFVVTPFALPPVEGDQEAQGEAAEKDVEF